MKKKIANQIRARLRRGRSVGLKRSDEKGLALLMALAVTSLLILIGTAFTLTAIYSAEGARLAGQVIKTRLMIESATQDALSVVSLAFNDPDQIENMMPATKLDEDNKFGPITLGSAWNGRYYWTSLSEDSAGLAEAFHHTISGSSITPAANSTLMSPLAGWVPSQDGDGSSAITARYAYLIIDESGQVDINASIQDTTAEGTEASIRIGADPNEVSLVDVTGSATFAASLQRVGVEAGQLPVGLTWLSWHYLLSRNTLAPSNVAAINTPGIFPFSQEIEAFYDNGKDYHRFNLARTDWDSFNNSVATSKITTDATEYWVSGNAVADNEGGIPWLMEATTQANQIAANMIDFADADSIATTDSETAPTYVGLEKVPYINEVSLNVALAANRLTVSAWVELANVYADAVGSGGKITITFDVVSNDVNQTGQTIQWTSLADVPAASYSGLNVASKIVVNGGAPASIANFKLTNITIKLTDSSDKLWDFASVPDTSTTTINSLVHQNAVEVNDPRHNTPAEEWTWLDWGSAGTLGKKNNSCLAPAGDANNDYEAADYMGTQSNTDEINLSTAFIKDAPFESLWQLGCIHRGQAWQTLNLSTYPADIPEAKPSRNALPPYNVGDAGILDQVKLSDDDEIIGKININTYSQRTIRGLLANLRITGDHADPTDSGTTEVTIAKADEVAGTPGSLAIGEWLFENGSEVDTGKPFITRAELASIAKLTDGTLGTQETDAAREEAIGKIASFCSTRSNYFTMIIVAQSVKDLPTGVKGGTRGVFDEGVDKILAEQRTRTILRRDAYRNEFDVIRHDLFID